jgi:hypothetical protein
VFYFLKLKINKNNIAILHNYISKKKKKTKTNIDFLHCSLASWAMQQHYTNFLIKKLNKHQALLCCEGLGLQLNTKLLTMQQHYKKYI